MSITPIATVLDNTAPTSASQPIRQEVQLILPNTDDPSAVAMSRRGILTCKAGQAIARRVDIPGECPRDPDHILLAELRLGKHIAWDAKQGAFASDVSGRVLVRQNKIDIEEVLELTEDIDSINGILTYGGQLVLRGNVLDLATIRTTGNTVVHGSIEAAEVHTEGDLHVMHGICGKERGHASARGCITTRFVTNARATSGGNMIIANEIINSHLYCGGFLKVEHGTIVGGHAIAREGIQCHSAGSEAGVKTILEVGFPHEQYVAIEQRLITAKSHRQKAQDIRNAVGPLMARAKTLTAAQKEKATELLFAADEAETQSNEAIAAVEQSRASLLTCLGSKIILSGMLYPGVTIRFPTAEALATAQIRGPVEVVLSSKDNESQIVVIDRCRNTRIPLQPVPSVGGAVDVARRILSNQA